MYYDEGADYLESIEEADNRATESSSSVVEDSSNKEE